MTEFRMPSLGADMTEGTLLRWLVRPGDRVRAGDIVAEVDTTKAAIEVECFDDGVIGEILVPEGTTVPVGAPLATILQASPGPDLPEPPPAALEKGNVTSAEAAASGEGNVTPAEVAAPGETNAVPAEAVASAGNGRAEVRATPLVRRLAEEAGLDLAAVHGSGPHGRVVRADVEEAAAHREPATASPPPGGPQPEPVVVADLATVPSPAATSAVSAHRVQCRRGHPAGPDHVRSSGYARRVAADLAVDLAAVAGTGPGGAVRARDVRTAAARRVVEPVAAGEPPQVRAGAPDGTAARDLGAMRDRIAAAMTKSKQTVPHYYLSTTVDVAAATERLRAWNLALPVAERILLPALLFRAIAVAARRVPELNGHWVDGAFRPSAVVHLGVVVALRGGGIIVPAVPHADTLDPPAMMAALRGLVSRARSGRLRSSDTTDATVTVTNLGDLGVDSVYGVVPIPQVAIVGLGAVSDRPCAVGGLLGVRPQVTATLSADHRASDGATGARFLNTVATLLRQPEEL
ncbi:dihydrolipoamide acetyltransferase family protein [Nocardia blacklockiae]|uniref:dihydrolipoamide acetyltransferase family protein n=1 Tax=Nocardia blacklockiae TaxID=480036 RepID=UPI001895F44F|nr:dihydrolipoamide acetyltransferase family protein [Nocardia blacklockiae]MBF6176620.1 2-oxo acid dehydrogenase subunit E2 [Nocardia blacklockiae]